MEFVYMVNEETESSHQFPKQDDVIAYQEARGWKVVDPPEEKPFVSEHLDIEPDVKWVTLVHEETSASHDFPNNPEAIEGAYESGWKLPEVEVIEEDSADMAEEEKPKKTAKKTASAKSADDQEKVN